MSVAEPHKPPLEVECVTIIYPKWLGRRGLSGCRRPPWEGGRGGVRGRWVEDGGRWQVSGGRWTVGGRLWAEDSVQWAMGVGRWTVDDGRW